MALLNVGKRLAGRAQRSAYANLIGNAGFASTRASRLGHNLTRGMAYSGLGALGAIGLAGAGFQHMVANNDKPRDTPLMDAIFAVATGDPQIDRKMLGTDVGMGTMFLPRLPGSNFALINSQTFGDTRYMREGGGGMIQNQAAAKTVGQIVTNGYSDSQYLAARSMPGIRYQPSTRRPSNMVNGSMVFGMYNMRQG